MLDRLNKLRLWLQSDLFFLAGVLLMIGGVYGFAKLWDEVREGDTETFDAYVLHALGGRANPGWLEEVGRDLTALGGLTVLTLVILGVSGFLLLSKKYHAFVLLLIATAGGMLLSFGLKQFIDRPRPDLVMHRSFVMTASFPSAHAMMSAVVYLTLGTLLARLTPSIWLKLYFVFVAMLLTGLVGVSRVFLGVHWPTDVLAGWCLGLVWAILCWAVARWLQRRGAVEQPRPEAAADARKQGQTPAPSTLPHDRLVGNGPAASAPRDRTRDDR